MENGEYICAYFIRLRIRLLVDGWEGMEVVVWGEYVGRNDMKTHPAIQWKPYWILFSEREGEGEENFINLNNQRLHTKKGLTCKKVSFFSPQILEIYLSFSVLLLIVLSLTHSTNNPSEKWNFLKIFFSLKKESESTKRDEGLKFSSILKQTRT